MTDTLTPPDTADRDPGLLSRMVGILLSPRATYAAVAAHPRIVGVLLVTLLATAAVQLGFMSSQTGQEALREALGQQIRQAQAQGAQGGAASAQNIEQFARIIGYGSAVASLVLWPLVLAALAGVATGIGNALRGGNATFRHVYAVFAHAGVVLLCGTAFSTGIMSLNRDAAVSPTRLAVFVPGLSDTSFWSYFLGVLDLVWIWWIVSLAIGLAVLYKQRTGPLATLLLGLYGTLALLVAVVRSL